MNNGLVWLLQRISAILLIIVLLVHFWVLHYRDPGVIVVYGNVAFRLKTTLYLVIDSVLLLAGLSHGLTGLHNIWLDYGVTRSVRVNSTVILVIVGTALFVLGMYALLHFTL